MTIVESIEDKIYLKEIVLQQHNYDNLKAVSIKMDSKYGIFFNPKLFRDSIDLHTGLCHEYYHCETDSFYTFNDSSYTVQKKEFQANYKMALDLCPPELIKCYMQHHEELWELSDFLGLTEEFLKEAIRIYRSKGLL